MTSFSRSALEMLQAAEEALTQPHSIRSTKRPTSAYAYKSDADYPVDASPYGLTVHQDPNVGVDGGITNEYQRPRSGYSNRHHQNSDDLGGYTEVAVVRELQSQLSRAVRELIELRAELAAERDRRNDTLVALGRQWKEEVLVAVHRRDAALQSDVAALEEKVSAQLKEGGEGRLVLRRQMDDLMRGSKIRDTDRFQLREELQETTRQLEARVEAAVAQSGAARTDCSRQLEAERAALSQRLANELMQLVEMRREDQRALQAAREMLQQDGQRMRDEVRRAVQEVWETSAAALIKTATEPVEQLRAELRQCRAAVQGAEEKVSDCVRSCQAECRLHTTTTKERLHALESNAAVATSRVDRAERKADGAYEVVHRMESAVQSAKDATERALLQAASALERTQKVEHGLSDRDARLVAVESQLHAISTAEGLKAEVEGCKRQAGRLESRMDATAALCERVEQVADKTLRQVADFTDRVGGCEKAVQRSSVAVQEVQAAMVGCQADVQESRTRQEACDGTLQRHGLLLTQFEQRIVGQENRLGLWRQQQEQHVKDQQSVQREVAERAEVMHAMATRAQQVSSDARAEVSRLERRFDDVDRALTSNTTDATAQRAALESLRSQGLEMQRQQQQLDDQLRGVEARVMERVAPLADLERTVAQRFERSEAQAERATQKLAQCEKQIQEMGARVQDYVKEAIRHHVGESQRRLLQALNEGISRLSDRVNTVEGTVTDVQTTTADAPQQLQALHEACTAQQRNLQGLESRLQGLRGHVEQLSLHAEAQSDDHQRLGTIQQDVTRLGALQQRLQHDVQALQELVHMLREMQLNATTTSREQTLSHIMPAPQAQTSTEMAPTANDGNSSSPSAHIPPGAGAQRGGTVAPSSTASARNTTNTTSMLAAPQPQSSQQSAKNAPLAAVAPTTTVTPPLVSTATKAAPALQAQQDQQRASSNSTEGSKEGSLERPASHLSGVSSVRPTEEVAKLHSLAEGALRTASSEDDDGREEEDEEGSSEAASGRDQRRVVHVGALVPQRQQQENSSRLFSARTAQSRVTNGADTAEKLSAPAAAASTQVSGLANTSHQTAIRGFTTIASTSSDSDEASDASDDDSGALKHAKAARQAGAARREENTDDISSDLTTAVTLTSEAAATPQRGAGGNASTNSAVAAAGGASSSRRVRPATAQQRRTVTMTATSAWGHDAVDSAAEGPLAASGQVAETSDVQPVAANAASSPAAPVADSRRGSADEEEESSDDSDVVQAVGMQGDTTSEDHSGGAASADEEVESEDADSVAELTDHEEPPAAVQGNAWGQSRPVGPVPSQRQMSQHTPTADARGGLQDTEGTESSVPPPRHPEWDDWDEDGSDGSGDATDEDGEEGGGGAHGNTPQRATAPVHAAPAATDSSDASDMVMQMDAVDEMEETPQPTHAQNRQPQQQLQQRPRAAVASMSNSDTSSSSAAPSRMAATTVHHRSGNTATAEELRPTERRTFTGGGSSGANAHLGASPEPRHVVPRHGQNTTSSSSSSAERAEALGLRPAGVAAPGPQRTTPQVRHYTNFDDSTTSDDDE